MRTLQLDAAVDAKFKELLRDGAPPEVGLLLGRLDGASKGYILLTCRTPDVAGSPALTCTAASKAAAKKGSSKASPPAVSAQLDADTVSEHALEVARTLPGGLAVVGMYLWAPAGVLQAVVSAVVEVLEGLHDLPGARFASGCKLVKVVESETGSGTVKELPTGAKVLSDARSCELRTVQQLLTSFVQLRSRYGLSAAAALGSHPPTSRALQHLVQQEAARAGAAALLLPDGSVVTADSACSTTVPNCGLSKEGVIHCELIVPATCALQGKAGSVAGAAQLHGHMEAVAVVHTRDAAERALTALQADIHDSLHTRLELLTESTLEPNAGEDGDEGGTGAMGPGDAAAGAVPSTALFGGAKQQVQLPRRVLCTAKAPLVVSDYLLPSESSLAAVGEHMLELFGWEVEQDSQVTPLDSMLKVPPPSRKSVTWDPCLPVSSIQPASAQPSTDLNRRKSSTTGTSMPGLLHGVWLLMLVLVVVVFAVAYLHSRAGWEDDDESVVLEQEVLQETWE